MEKRTEFKFKDKVFSWASVISNEAKVEIYNQDSTYNCHSDWVMLERYVTGNCQMIAVAYFNRLAYYLDSPKDFKDFFLALYQSMADNGLYNQIESVFGGNGYFLLDIEKHIYQSLFKKDFENPEILDYNFMGQYVNTYDRDDFVYLQILHDWINDEFDSLDVFDEDDV